MTLRESLGRPRRPASFGTYRLLPWDSALTRVWPGTKILCWTALSTALLIWPTWSSVGILTVVLLGASIVAHVPLSVLPRPPSWFWGGLVGGAVGSWLGGDLLIFVRASSVTLLIVWGTALMVFTTPTSRMIPAIRTFLSPLRFVGVPAGEWTHVMALALKSIPLMTEQSRTVTDTALIRFGRAESAGIRQLLRRAVDTVTASLSAASQRSRDMGRSMSMRGGHPTPMKDSVSWGLGDNVTIIITVITVITMGVIAVFSPLTESLEAVRGLVEWVN